MSKERLYIFDTTLRDGAQTQGVHFSIDEKTKIAHALDDLGVDYIEGGWPGANPSDTEFFQKGLDLKNSTFTAFGMTKKSGRSAQNDPGLSAILNSKSSFSDFRRRSFSTTHFGFFIRTTLFNSQLYELKSHFYYRIFLLTPDFPNANHPVAVL